MTISGSQQKVSSGQQQPNSMEEAAELVISPGTPGLPEEMQTRGANKEHIKKKWGRFALRAAITVVLFVFLLRSVSWPLLVKTLFHVDQSFLLMGLAVGVVTVIFSVYGWCSLLLAEGISIDFARLIDLYLVGISFNHFLPTSMGGDAVKAYYSGKYAGNFPGATSSVMMTRIVSFGGMLLLTLPTLVIMRAHFRPEVAEWLALLCLLLLAAIAGTILAAALLPRVAARFLQGPLGKSRILLTVLEIGAALNATARKPRALIASTLFGMLFWISSFLNYYGYATALGLHLPLYFYMIAIPFVSIVAALPISINGFGVRESTFVFLFSTVHVAGATSLLLALLVDAQMLLFGILGGCIYFAMDSKKLSKQPDTQPQTTKPDALRV